MAGSGWKGSIPKEDIAEIKSRVRISDIVAERTPVRRSGKAMVCACPFHDDSRRSMVMYDEDGKWECMSTDCKANRHAMGGQGDVIRFLQMRDGLTFAEAVESLADRVGYRIDYKKPEGASHERGKGKAAPSKAKRDDAARAKEPSPKAAPARKEEPSHERKLSAKEERKLRREARRAERREREELDLGIELDRARPSKVSKEEMSEFLGVTERDLRIARNPALVRREGRKSRKKLAALGSEGMEDLLDAQAKEGFDTLSEHYDRLREKSGKAEEPKVRLDKGLRTSVLSEDEMVKQGIDPEKAKAARKGAKPGAKAPGVPGRAAEPKQPSLFSKDALPSDGAKAAGKPRPERPWRKGGQRSAESKAAAAERRAQERAEAVSERKAALAGMRGEMAERAAQLGARGPLKTLHVGILGGPGAGKGAAAAALAATLRERGWRVGVAESVVDGLVRDGYAQALVSGDLSIEETIVQMQREEIARFDGKYDVVVCSTPPVSALAYVSEESERAQAFEKSVMDAHKEGREFTFFLRREQGAPFDETAHVEDRETAVAMDGVVYGWSVQTADDGLKRANFDRASIDDGLVARQVERVYARAYGMDPADLKPRSFALAELRADLAARPVASEIAETALAQGWKPSEVGAIARSYSDERLAMVSDAVARGMGFEEARAFLGKPDGSGGGRPGAPAAPRPAPKGASARAAERSVAPSQAARVAAKPAPSPAREGRAHGGGAR